MNDAIKSLLERGRVKLDEERNLEAAIKANEEARESARLTGLWNALTDKAKSDLPKEFSEYIRAYLCQGIEREPGRAEIIEIRIKGLAPIRIHYESVNGNWQRYSELIVCSYFIRADAGRIAENWSTNTKASKTIGIALAYAEEAQAQHDKLQDELCDQCQGEQDKPEDAHLESAYEERTEIFE